MGDESNHRRPGECSENVGIVRSLKFRDFGEAIEKGRKPLVSGEEGWQALEICDAVYRSCRSGEKVVL